MAKLSNQSSKEPILRRQKGWYGFVHGYKNFITKVDWESIDWGKGTAEPKSIVKDEMGKITIKY